jgi:hypothetical protein
MGNTKDFIKLKIASAPKQISNFLESNSLHFFKSYPDRKSSFHIKKYAEGFEYCFFEKESLRLAIDFTCSKVSD